MQACQTLFGKEVNVSRDFLFYVQPSGVKSAYRKKAKENHPDLYAADPLHVQQKQTVLFREILSAYDVLNLFFKQRDGGAWRVDAPNAASQAARAKKASSPKSSSKGAWTKTERRSKPRPAASSDRKGDNTYYHGTVPFRTLQIGQYLYYRGKISFGALINALVWQRKQRPTIGDLALRWGWLDENGINKLSKTTNLPRRFGEKAVELGLLTVFQVNTILMYQRSQQVRLGEYFRENELLSQQQLDQLVAELHEHNAAVIIGKVRPDTKQRAYV